MTREQALRLVGIVTLAYPALTLTEANVTYWRDKLTKFDYERALPRVEQFVEECRKNAPALADVVQAIRGTDEQRMLEARAVIAAEEEARLNEAKQLPPGKDEQWAAENRRRLAAMIRAAFGGDMENAPLSVRLGELDPPATVPEQRHWVHEKHNSPQPDICRLCKESQ